MSEKIFSSVLSRDPDPLKAVENAASKILKDFQDKSRDAALVFLSEGYAELDAAAVMGTLQSLLSVPVLIGCNSNGVIGDKSEIEMEPALSVLAMHLPNVRIVPFTLSPHEIESLSTGKDLVENLDIYPNDSPKFLCFADPMTCDAAKLLFLLNEGYPGLPVTGGFASGGMAAGAENWIVLNGDVNLRGAVGLAFIGDVSFETLVSQGCRPIGEALAVTKAEGNVLQELAGKPALEAFGEIYKNLSPLDQELAHHSLFVGLAMDETRSSFKRGDFLIRNIMGADRASGALAVGENLVIGQTLQFQLRDAKASTEDLEALLKLMHRKETVLKEAAILVSCCGRGKALFGQADHDVKLIQKYRGPFPLAGFFANGEFGPVEGKNYVHGYTSSLTIIS
ncbi:MAG TPA: FIST N-terminal domain-containing protein [Verrucomicrobiae bacterium]|nr:FIST N-terminal domain-containing protein [Verrucomicrobiae bacterium]